MPKLKIFIAGHKGMVGSAIFRQLKDQEVEIITKDRNKANKIHNLMKMSKYLEHKNGSDRRYSVKVTKRIEK